MLEWFLIGLSMACMRAYKMESAAAAGGVVGAVRGEQLSVRARHGLEVE